MLDADWLEKRIRAELIAAGVPGLALAIVQNEHIIYAQGFGQTRGDELGVDVTPHTLFRIASVTKPLTGTALMRLVEIGKVALDTPVCAYIPRLTLHDARAAQTITLRMLLNHTSGLPFEYVLHGDTDTDALQRYVEEDLPRLSLVAAPDTQWHYSNPGYNLAGYVAQVVSGLPFPDLMQQHVFAPLAMRQTTFDADIAHQSTVACSHTPQENGSLRVEPNFRGRGADYAAGGAFSSILDLANFALMHLNEGRFNQGQFGSQQVLSPASVAAMQTARVATNYGFEERYGLSFFVTSYRGQPRIGHWGGVEGYAGRLALLPAARLGVVALYNRMASRFDPDALIDVIFDRYLNDA